MASDPEALPETTYRRSGKVNWLRLAPYTIVMLGVTVLMAYVLYRAFAAGWYYFIAIPAVLSLPVGLAAYIAVAGGHCRNQLVAMFAGAIAGLVLYLGYFHLHFVSLTGRQALTRVDLLPRFIQFRMQTDVVVDELEMDTGSGSVRLGQVQSKRIKLDSGTERPEFEGGEPGPEVRELNEIAEWLDAPSG